VDTGGPATEAPPASLTTSPPPSTPPPPPVAFLSPADAPPEAASCDEAWTEASGELEAVDELVMSETMLMSGESEEGGPIRSRCVETLVDFTLPALHPDNRAGEIPKTLALDLFTDVQLTARVIYWTWNDDGSVSWIGETVEQPQGTVVITVVDGWYSATIRKGKYSWTLKPDQACGGHWLGEYQDDWDGEDFVCGTDAEEEEGFGMMSGMMSSLTDSGDTGEPEPAVVDYGVQPDHPDRVLPTIDVLFVATQAAADALGWTGQEHGLIGYAHNRVHELDLTFLRTERQRTHRPRAVGVVVDNTSNDFLMLDGDGCHDDNFRAFQASFDMQALRDDAGADFVTLMIGDAQGSPGCLIDPGEAYDAQAFNSSVGWRPGGTRGVFSILNSVYTFDAWSFSHEAGHELGAGHENVRSHGNASPHIHSYSDYKAIATHFESQLAFDYKMLVARGNVVGCRTPVFPRNSPVTGFGWLPASTNSGTDLCEYDDTATSIYEPRYSLDAFGPNKYRVGLDWGDEGLTPGTLNGVPIGRVDLDSPGPIYDFFRCQGDVLFQLSGDDDPWSEPDIEFPSHDPNPCEISADEDHSLAEMVAFYRPATTQPLEDDLEPVVDVSPGSPGQIGAPVITIHFNMSNYADELSQPPGPTVCTDPVNQNCDFDINPYYLEIGTTFGAEDVVSQWVTVGACNPTTGACTVTPSTPIVTDGDDGPYAPLDLGTVYFGRLWTQVSANDWGYREFRLNTDVPHPALSCVDDSGEFAPPLGYDFACPASANAFLASSILVAADEQDLDSFPNHKTLRINLDPGAGVTQGGRAHVDHYRTTEFDKPYDLVAFGELSNGTEFCCLYTFPDDEVVGVEVRGTNGPDTISLGAFVPLGFTDSDEPRFGQFGHVGAEGRAGEDFIGAGTTPELRSYLHGGSFGDVMVTGSLVHGYVKGEGHRDWMAAYTEPRTGAWPNATLRVDGGGDSDTLIARSATSRRDHGHVQMFGGGGGNILCTDSGAVKMVGSAAGHNFANTLYISSSYNPTFFLEYDIHPETSAAGFGSACGAQVHYTLQGDWAGSCVYDPAAPFPVGDPLLNNGCVGWVVP
jgi:hypothetical protein